MKASSKRNLTLAIGIGISIALLYLLFRNIEVAKLMAALGEADYWWLLPNIAMIIITMYQRAYRWKYMLAPIKKVSFDRLLAATCIGFMANNVLPLRLGEFVRAYSLSRQDKGVTKSASLATIFVERMVFDLMALLMIFGAVVLFSRSLRDKIQGNLVYAIELAIAVAVVGMLSMIVLALRPNKVGELLTRYVPFLPESVQNSIRSVILKFSRGLEFLRNAPAVINVAGQTFLIWILMGISNYFVFRAFGFDIPIDASFVLLVVVSILILAPSTPGFLGVYHYGVVLSLSVYGITDERAVSCSIVLHAAQYIVVTLMGFYFLRKAHLSLSELGRDAETGLDES